MKPSALSAAYAQLSTAAEPAKAAVRHDVSTATISRDGRPVHNPNPFGVKGKRKSYK